MFGAIAALLGIVLTALLTGATIYYGGGVSQTKAVANANQTISQAKQLVSAAELYYDQTGSWPSTVTDLQTNKQLNVLPTPPAYTSMTSWALFKANTPTVVLYKQIDQTSCQQINQVVRGDSVIYNAARPDVQYQCFGTTAPYTFIGTSGRYTAFPSDVVTVAATGVTVSGNGAGASVGTVATDAGLTYSGNFSYALTAPTSAINDITIRNTTSHTVTGVVSIKYHPAPRVAAGSAFKYVPTPTAGCTYAGDFDTNLSLAAGATCVVHVRGTTVYAGTQVGFLDFKETSTGNHSISPNLVSTVSVLDTYQLVPSSYSGFEKGGLLYSASTDVDAIIGNGAYIGRYDFLGNTGNKSISYSCSGMPENSNIHAYVVNRLTADYRIRPTSYLSHTVFPSATVTVPSVGAFTSAGTFSELNGSLLLYVVSNNSPLASNATVTCALSDGATNLGSLSLTLTHNTQP